jgi:hypothetical protein
MASGKLSFAPRTVGPKNKSQRRRTAAAEWPDHQAPPPVRLGVAGSTQRDQVVDVKVRATARPFDHMMDIQPPAPPAGLAAPSGAAPHFGADDLPLLG